MTKPDFGFSYLISRKISQNFRDYSVYTADVEGTWIGILTIKNDTEMNFSACRQSTVPEIRPGMDSTLLLPSRQPWANLFISAVNEGLKKITASFSSTLPPAGLITYGSFVRKARSRLGEWVVLRHCFRKPPRLLSEHGVCSKRWHTVTPGPVLAVGNQQDEGASKDDGDIE